MRWWDYVVVVALMAFGVGCSWFINRREIDAALEVRPPIVVVDYGPVAKALSDGKPAKEIQPLFAELKRRATLLRDAGFLVLNAATVDGAPASVMVTAPAELSPVPPKPTGEGTVSVPTVTPAEAGQILSDFFGARGTRP